MKKVFTSVTFCVLGLLFSSSVFGQATATATAAATIVAPIGITKVTDMNFGNVATNGQVGTVVLSPESGRTSTGGVTLPADNGTVTAASFEVEGSSLYTYAITLPASVTISDGGNSMIVNTFTSNPSSTGVLDATSGTQIVNVGATLNLAAGQAAGEYISDVPFAVTVNYN